LKTPPKTDSPPRVSPSYVAHALVRAASRLFSTLVVSQALRRTQVFLRHRASRGAATRHAGVRAPHWYSFCAGVVAASVVLYAVELGFRVQSGQLQVTAPRLQILEGRALERLQNGATVGYDFQLQVLADSKATVLRRTAARYLFSYDLWEEKFSVTRVSGPRRSASHLSAEEAESWCLEQISLPAAEIPSNQSVWLRLDVRADEPPRGGRSSTETGVSLTDLIEVFGRTTRPSQQKWTFEGGPVRVDQLKSGSG
jgi:hypothetical protein